MNGKLAGAILLVASTYSAEPAMADGGFYIGGGAGRSQLGVENAQVPPFVVTLNGNGNTYKLYGGWKAPAFFGVETGFYNFGSTRASKIANSGTAEMKGVGAFGTLRLGIPLVPVELIGKVGGMWWDGQIAVAQATTVSKLDASGFAPAFGLGAETGLMGLNLRLEYERVQADKSGFKPVELLTVSVNYTF